MPYVDFSTAAGYPDGPMDFPSPMTLVLLATPYGSFDLDVTHRTPLEGQ
jgi:hypothetical protein